MSSTPSLIEQAKASASAPVFIIMFSMVISVVDRSFIVLDLDSSLMGSGLVSFFSVFSSAKAEIFFTTLLA